MSNTQNKSYENRCSNMLYGTKPSVKNAQVRISMGILSLDNLIGGGLPIGSIFLLEEDTYGYYSQIMLKYFLAEGCVSSDSLFVASQDMAPEKLVMDLPEKINENQLSQLNSPLYSTNDRMQIAWRYQNMKISDSSLDTKMDRFGHYYDVTKKMNKDIIARTKITYWNGIEYEKQYNGVKNNVYTDLLTSIQKTLEKRKLHISTNHEPHNVMRIGILSLGSRLWLANNDYSSQLELAKFLYCLRAVLRHYAAVAAITVPIKNFESNGILERIEHLADTVVSLKLSTECPDETNFISNNYHGLLHLKKSSASNTLEPYCPETYEFGFKLRRKKFAIEVLHLPPGDLNHSNNTDTSFSNQYKTSQNLLDF